MNDASSPLTRRSPKQRRERFTKERPPAENEDTPWRLFIAVPLPAEVRTFMAEIVAELTPLGWPIRWVEPENGHLTIHFIGDQPPESAELLRLALRHVLGDHEAFDLRTADLGAFPNIRGPRVLWLGLWGPAHRLESIYNDVGDFLDTFGIELEEKPFHPHITLGRVRQVQDVKVSELAASIRETFDALTASGRVSHDRPVPFPVTEVQLVRSHLDAVGSTYEILERYPLASPE